MRNDRTRRRNGRLPLAATALAAALLGSTAGADGEGGSNERVGRGVCAGVPEHAALLHALRTANDKVTADNPGLPLDNEMWGALVAADGTVCAVADSGEDNLQSQWLASRVIAMQKANTANSLSLGKGGGGTNAGLALSSANLWAAVQPGGSLYGLQFSNPVEAYTAYRGRAGAYGTSRDPAVGHRTGGINVFGGGLALYGQAGDRVGGVGVSGDTSCRDHLVAWELRHELGLDHVAAGVSGDPLRPDNIIFDVGNGFGHPTCLAPDLEKEAAGRLTPVPAP